MTSKTKQLVIIALDQAKQEILSRSIFLSSQATAAEYRAASREIDRMISMAAGFDVREPKRRTSAHTSAKARKKAK